MAAAKNAKIPAYARINNSVRLEFEAEKREDRGLSYIVKDLLFGLFQLTPDKILALQDYHVRGVYDVTFINKKTCLDFVRKLQQHGNHTLLDCVKVIPHYEEENLQALVVKMYNPNLPQEDITSWLSLYCDKVIFLHKITNQFGLWTGKRKFLVSFKKDTLPPARFSIGKHNGDLFFDGMASFCRICHMYGHTADLCKERHRCRNCDSFEHETLSCPGVKRCNFCLRPGHIYSNCPHRNKTEKTNQAAAANSEVKSHEVKTSVVKSSEENSSEENSSEVNSFERENPAVDSTPPAVHSADTAAGLMSVIYSSEVNLFERENPAAASSPPAVHSTGYTAGSMSVISEANETVTAETSASHQVSVTEKDNSVLEKKEDASLEAAKGKEQRLKYMTRQHGRSREGKQGKSPGGDEDTGKAGKKAKKLRTGSPTGESKDTQLDKKSWAEIVKSSISKDSEEMESSPITAHARSAGDHLVTDEIPITSIGLASPKQDFLNTDLVFQLSQVMGMDPSGGNMDF